MTQREYIEVDGKPETVENAVSTVESYLINKWTKPSVASKIEERLKALPLNSNVQREILLNLFKDYRREGRQSAYETDQGMNLYFAMEELAYDIRGQDLSKAYVSVGDILKYRFGFDPSERRLFFDSFIENKIALQTNITLVGSGDDVCVIYGHVHDFIDNFMLLEASSENVQ